MTESWARLNRYFIRVASEDQAFSRRSVEMGPVSIFSLTRLASLRSMQTYMVGNDRANETNVKLGDRLERRAEVAQANRDCRIGFHSVHPLGRMNALRKARRVYVHSLWHCFCPSSVVVVVDS